MPDKRKLIILSTLSLIVIFPLFIMNPCSLFRPKWYTISEFRTKFEIDASEHKFEKAIR